MDTHIPLQWDDVKQEWHLQATPDSTTVIIYFKSWAIIEALDCQFSSAELVCMRLYSSWPKLT